MNGQNGDRRTEPRIEMIRPCKVYDPQCGKYVTGMTWNVSQNGMMLEVDRPLGLRPGDRIYIGVAFKRDQGLLIRNEMLEAQVLRSALDARDHTAVAVQLAEPLEWSRPAPRHLQAA